jgi:hypothetical protein
MSVQGFLNGMREIGRVPVDCCRDVRDSWKEASGRERMAFGAGVALAFAYTASTIVGQVVAVQDQCAIRSYGPLPHMYSTDCPRQH